MVKTAQFADTQPRPVKQFHDGGIASSDPWFVGSRLYFPRGRGFDEADGIFFAGGTWQADTGFRGCDQPGGIVGHLSMPLHVDEPGANGGNSPLHGRFRQFFPEAVAKIAAQLGGAHGGGDFDGKFVAGGLLPKFGKVDQVPAVGQAGIDGSPSFRFQTG